MAQVNSGSHYKLINGKAGTALDLSGGDGKSIIGYEFHGGENQVWRVDRRDQGWVLHTRNGQFLGIEGQAGDGTRVVALNEPFIWDIWPDEEDPSVHRLFVPNTVFNIDLSDHGNPTPGTPVELWGKWNGRNQTWRFEEA